jgi:hypothetical protein
MQYRSEFPYLNWQFIVFGHNEHEIKAAEQMAQELNMTFQTKLSNNDSFSPVKDMDLVRKEMASGVASRAEYKKKYGKSYSQRTCLLLWSYPQMNFDGRMLGCCENYKGDYGNVFQDGLLECLNNEKMNYARQMLLGHEKSREDIPCTRCSVYKGMNEMGIWIKKEDIVRKDLEMLNGIAKRKDMIRDTEKAGEGQVR